MRIATLTLNESASHLLQSLLQLLLPGRRGSRPQSPQANVEGLYKLERRKHQRLMFLYQLLRLLLQLYQWLFLFLYQLYQWLFPFLQRLLWILLQFCQQLFTFLYWLSQWLHQLLVCL